MSSTPIANSSMVAAPGPAVPGVPLYGSTSLNTNEPLYSPSTLETRNDGTPSTIAPVTKEATCGVAAISIEPTSAGATATTTVAPPSTFHDASIEAARSSTLRLGICEMILGGSLFGLMMWTYQAARVSAQMSLVLGIILLCHSSSKTAPLMRNKAYGGCCAQVCPWKILRVTCAVSTVINMCSALAMAILAILSLTIWSEPEEGKEGELLATQICCSAGAVLSFVAGLLAWKARKPCTTINERLASLVADGILVVSFEYMWCKNPYLAPVVVASNTTTTATGGQQMISVATGAPLLVVATPVVDGQQVESSWNYTQVEVQPVVPMQQDDSVVVQQMDEEEKAAFSV